MLFFNGFWVCGGTDPAGYYCNPRVPTAQMLSRSGVFGFSQAEHEKLQSILLGHSA
jgi:hypothetical protein